MVDYEKSPTELDFDFIYQRLYDYWKNIALSIIEWDGLEEVSDNLTSQIIEEQLFDEGMSAFKYEDVVGFYCLPAKSQLDKNIYGKPQKVAVFAKNGKFNAILDVDDCVLIKNNNLAKPTSYMLQYYCTKLAEIELTKQLNLNANKMPICFYGDQDTLLTNKNIFKKIRTNEPVIFKNRMPSDNKGMEVLNANSPYILDKLEDDYNCYVAKILTLLGLDNYIEDKAERVQSAEVDANQEYIIMNFKTMLDNRQKACDEINKKYGLHLSIRYVKGQQIEPEDETTPNNEEDIANE